MSHITVKSLRAIEPYSGPNAIPGIRFRAVRGALGVSAWGMNVLELDPKCEGYPEHDHEKDGQEEVYLVLEGSAVLVAEGSERNVSEGDFILVPPGVKRKFVTRDEGVKLLALGGTPGKAYPSS
jgi:mannose-6-phosphate isomerase-like protein (cupin superfamily)